MPNPLVTVVVLNWNGKEHLLECLGSVIHTSYAPVEIIVSDNGSIDGSVESVRALYPEVSVVENGKNIGYAAGNNQGIAAAQGEYVVTLNNDTVVEPDWLECLVAPMEKEPALFAACGRQMNYYRRSVIDSLFHYPGPGLLFLRAGHGETMEQNSGYALPGYVIAVNGGSAIYRKKMFLELGGFDRAFQFYNEETDLCMRAFLRGWKCLFVPQSVVYHKEGESFRKTEVQGLYYHERNKMWFLYKYYPLSFVISRLVPLVLEEMHTIKRDVFMQRAPLRYITARMHGCAGLRRYGKERKKNVPLFRIREEEFIAFQEKKIIPLS
jgi:GT2 family glycosyltransferase